MRCVLEARRGLIVSIATAIWMCPIASWAQSYPNKPVRYVVPFGPGGSPDLVARLLGERLSKLWGHQVVVDNRVGAAGVLGTAFVAKSAPDGHTLVQCNVASSGIAVSLNASMPYDQLRDLAAVSRIGMLPNVLTVHPSLPLKSIKEFIAYAGANPGKLSYAGSLVGTSPHLSMEWLKLIAKFDVVHIPYRIGSQGISDTIAGQVPVGIFNLPASVAPVQAKRLRALAVTSAQRAAAFPDVPTIKETGFPNYEVNSWYGVCAPAATPAVVLDKLHADITAVLRMPDFQQRMSELVMDATPMSREEFDRFIRADIARWAHIIKEAKIPLQ
jgi:tripartite-type tricarboxylate transporter receptor subunit TctC